MSIVNFTDVSFKYPRSLTFALEKINLDIIEGEFLAVMGESGAGKTTLCRLLNGIIPHLCEGNLSGTVIVDGEKTIDFSVPHLASKVGMVADDPDAQLFTSKVYYEAAFALENLLLHPLEIKSRVKTALHAVGLAGFEDRAPSTLSGGEKQRLSIAAAIAVQGKILCLDDPLCRLDPGGAQDVMSVLKNLREKQHITIVMVSHDSRMIEQNADRVCVLKKGRVAAVDTAENIFANNVLLEENGIQAFKRDNFNIFFDGFSKGMRRRDEYTKINNEAQYAVKTSNLSFTYPGGTGIENINLSFADNDFTAIIGNNGCGKTTFLKCITGLLRPHTGDIFIRGRNTKEMKITDISREAGFVMQNPDTQLFTDTVFNETAFALRNMRLSKNEIKKRVFNALEITGLSGKEDFFPHALCKRDRTKTVIACVLAMGCRIIILDEADAGLDYRDSIKIMDIARDLHKKGFTIIFITHNMYLADAYARRLIKMNKNKIEFDTCKDQDGKKNI